MPHLPRLLIDLALVLGVAGAMGLVFHRLRLPVVVGYLLAGVMLGPHVPLFPFVRDEASIRTLAELGVTLLMFGLGLEFNLQRLWRAGPTAFLMGSMQMGFAVLVGYLAAQLFGFGRAEALFAGVAVAIPSTMVLARTLEEDRPGRALRDTLVSLLVVQDLFAILALTALTTFARVGGLMASDVLATLGRLGLFLILVLGLGRLLVPRLFRWAADRTGSETLLLAMTGFCFLLALGAAKAGFSMALGAFLAGMLASESGRRRAMEHLLHPVRDLFAAIFFVAVGMMLNPEAALAHPWKVLGFAGVVLGANALATLAGGLLAGLPFRLSCRTALALGHMGEFGYIILGTGVATGLVSPELYSIGIAVGALGALSNPSLVRLSTPVSHALEARLPDQWRERLGVYQAWAQALRQRGIRRGEGRDLLWPFLFLLADALLLAGMVVGHQVLLGRGVAWLHARSPLGNQVLQVTATALLGLVAAALVLGLLRQGRLLARDLAVLAPNPEGDGVGRRGRHVLAGGLRVALLLMVGLPLLGLLQPFAPQGLLLAVFLAVFLLTLGIQIQQGRRLTRESPAGTEWLMARVRDPWPAEPGAMDSAHGTLRALRIGPRCPSLGRSLDTLDLPGRAEVSVITLVRADGRLVPLNGAARLEEGDLLALSGSDQALDEAEALLSEPEELA